MIQLIFTERGHAEELLGEALRGVRDKCVTLQSSGKQIWHGNGWQPGLEEAMRRLQTDYIDVFFIHYPSETVPIEETMTELMRLKAEGKIGAIGVSNFSLEQMKEALRFGEIDVIQPCYSLLWRFIDRDILPFAIENKIAVIPYSPLGQGHSYRLHAARPYLQGRGFQTEYAAVCTGKL